MFDRGFDGMDVLVLVVPDAEPLIELYGDLLGFDVAVDDAPDTTAASLLGAPGSVSRLVHLSRGPRVGGDILLAESGTATQPVMDAIAPRKRGVYALDFYLRDAAATEAKLAEGGWAFTSPAVHYDLPGTTIPVRERMLVQHHSGLLHALVQHRPKGTRSILGTEPDGYSSETVAVVVLTPDLAAARDFASVTLGGNEYLHGVFAGPAVEEMLDLLPGAGLEAALYRGPGSRNARLEFACPIDEGGAPLPLEPEGQRRVLAGLLVDHLDELVDRLLAGDHGVVGGTGELEWAGAPRRAVRFDTRYDLGLLLLDGETTPQ